METTSLVQSITDEQIAEIEALASKATPGQWWIDSHGHNMVSLDDYQPIFSAKDLVKPAVRHPETGNLSHWPNDWDASYIATANPANILALISRLRAAESAADEYFNKYQAEHARAESYLDMPRALLRSDQLLNECRQQLRAAERDAARYRFIKANSPDAHMWSDESIDTAMKGDQQ